MVYNVTLSTIRSDGSSQNELTIIIDDTQTPTQIFLDVPNSSRFFIPLTNSDSRNVLNDNIPLPPKNSDEPLPSENSVESLSLVNSGESLPLVNSGKSLPFINSDDSLLSEDSGETLPLVGSDTTIPNNNNTFFSTNILYSEPEAMDLYSNSDLIDFDNNSRPISLLSTSCSTSSVHRFWYNYNNCGRIFRSQGEWQEHQYQHYRGSPFICLVEDCASFGTTFMSKSNLSCHYNNKRHSKQSHPVFQNTV
ncbi:hypothetical protein F8M41_015295 [Gigaspora margarita]|uniref:C2H2-type domain-containing protein n=1 Tax=Gigaspora margarita TaxID=4874 RepID=A0A8H4AQM2_GIGMA|nr:hypothetical protein F8M41_015295 [Gigaspora margarita]